MAVMIHDLSTFHHFFLSFRFNQNVPFLPGLASYMARHRRVNWSPARGPVLGFGGHRGRFLSGGIKVVFFRGHHGRFWGGPWKFPTYLHSHCLSDFCHFYLKTPNCMWFTNFTFTDGEVCSLIVIGLWIQLIGLNSTEADSITVKVKIRLLVSWSVIFHLWIRINPWSTYKYKRHSRVIPQGSLA